MLVISHVTKSCALRPSINPVTSFITRLPVARHLKSLTKIELTMIVTFPNAIVPHIINTTVLLLITATKGLRKTGMPPVTDCILPVVTVLVPAVHPRPTPAAVEAQPEMTVAIPVIILINPVVTPILMKPGALAGLILVPTVAAERVPVVLLARLPLLPAQAARLRPPVRVLLLVQGVRAHLLLRLLPAAAAAELLGRK